MFSYFTWLLSSLYNRVSGLRRPAWRRPAGAFLTPPAPAGVRSLLLAELRLQAGIASRVGMGSNWENYELIWLLFSIRKKN